MNLIEGSDIFYCIDAFFIGIVIIFFLLMILELLISEDDIRRVI